MGFYALLEQSKTKDLAQLLDSVTERDVACSLAKSRLSTRDFLSLLAPAAKGCLEQMAVKARSLTRQHFGQVIFLYAPLYAADFCENNCLYCSFSTAHDYRRKKLTMQELEDQAKALAKMGLKAVLLLTGESRSFTPAAYLKDCIRLLQKFFTSVSVEVYPLTEAEYRELAEAGLDGVTVYQEVYNETVYRRMHPQGPKADFRYRLETAERACRAGVRTVSIGALLGLDDWRREAFFTGLHAQYLQDTYPAVELGVSVPRIQPHLGSFAAPAPLADSELVQIILALRLFLPRVGIALSTRERPALRDALVGLGITRMSACSSTVVGGYTAKGKQVAQFAVSDSRSVEEIRQMLKASGYQPVAQDWHTLPQGKEVHHVRQ
ncbi:MAG: 2-iminoacetate synthase [Syntrophomonadaceae bacterium]|nr:2-iminoacetate synthase [Bacillota bacterium]